MDDRLVNYVREQLKKEVDKDVIRKQLESVGWPREDIEEAFNKATPTSSKPYILLTLLIFIVGMSTVLIVVGLNYSIEPSEPTPNGDVNDNNAEFNDENGVEDVDENSEEELDCEQIVSSMEKHDCYLEEVEDGLQCQSIEDEVERNYCYRASDELVFS